MYGLTKSKFCLFITDYGQSLTVSMPGPNNMYTVLGPVSMPSDLSDRNSNLQLLEFLFLYCWV